MKFLGRVAFTALVLIFAQGYFEPVSALQETHTACDAILALDNSGSMKRLDKSTLLPFIEGLRRDDRLGIILFGRNAELTHPLKAIETAEDKKLVLEALDKWDFSDQFTNFNPVFEIALQQFKSHSRGDAVKLLILLSDGKVDYGQAAGTTQELLSTLRNNMLPACRDAGIAVMTIAWGEHADFALMDDIADKTGGLFFPAPTRERLEAALNRIHQMGQPKVVFTPSIPPNPRPAEAEGESVPPVAQVEKSNISPHLSSRTILALGIAVAILMLLAVVTLIATIRNREYLMGAHSVQTAPAESKPVPPGSESPPSMVKLLKLISDAKSNLDTIQGGLRSYGADSYGEERASRENYSRVLGRLFYILDQIDVLQKTKQNFQGADWISERLGILLNDEDIQAIPARIGEQMNSLYHKCVEERSDAQPEGMIIEVVRNGYMLKRNEKELVLRPAEVVVSKGTQV